MGTGLHRACKIYIQSLDLYKAYIESSFIFVIESSSKIGRVFMPLKPGELQPMHTWFLKIAFINN